MRFHRLWRAREQVLPLGVGSGGRRIDSGEKWTTARRDLRAGVVRHRRPEVERSVSRGIVELARKELGRPARLIQGMTCGTHQDGRADAAEEKGHSFHRHSGYLS